MSGRTLGIGLRSSLLQNLLLTLLLFCTASPRVDSVVRVFYHVKTGWATNKQTEPQSKPLKMWETFKLSNNQVCPCWKCHSCDWNTGRIIRASTGLQEWVFLCLHAFNVHLEQIIKEVKATNIYNEQEINTFTDMLSSSNVACTAQRGHKGCLLNQRQSKNNWHPVDMTRRLLAILPSLM